MKRLIQTIAGLVAVMMFTAGSWNVVVTNGNHIAIGSASHVLTYAPGWIKVSTNETFDYPDGYLGWSTNAGAYWDTDPNPQYNSRMILPDGGYIIATNFVAVVGGVYSVTAYDWNGNPGSVMTNTLTLGGVTSTWVTASSATFSNDFTAVTTNEFMVQAAGGDSPGSKVDDVYIRILGVVTNGL